MAAEINFTARCKPTQVIIITLLDYKRRLGEIVFFCYALHQPVSRPFIDDAYGSLITAEHFICKSINNVLLHFFIPHRRSARS